MNVPTWWEAGLLALASYRVWRLLAEDKILQGPRARLLNALHYGLGLGEKANEFLLCPWCAGFWISGVATGLYAIVGELDVLGFLVTWFAISAVVGLLAGVQALVDRFNG